MQQKTLRALAVGSVLVLAGLGCLMRYYQIQTGFDASDLPIRGDVSIKLLAAISVLAFLLSVLCCRALPQHSQERGLFRPNVLSLLTGLAAGLVLAIGAVWSLVEVYNVSGLGIPAWLELLQLLAGMSVFTAAWLRWKRGGSMMGLHAVICLWQVLMLLLNFRNWSMDPTIADYCFRLFALICGMCGGYHVGAFCFGGGRRRISAFWCLAGVFFTLVSAIGESRSWQMMEFGMCLWLLSNVWQLYGEARSENHPEPIPEPEEAEKAEQPEQPVQSE